MNQCPYCHRRLISHISPRCNWCGQEINDAEYQAKADADREVFFAQQALHEAQSLMRAETLLVNNGDPFLAMTGRGRMWSTQPGFAPATGQVNGAAARVAAAQQAAYEVRVSETPTEQSPATPKQTGQIEPRFGTAVGHESFETPANQGNQDQNTDVSPQIEPQPTNRFQNLEL